MGTPSPAVFDRKLEELQDLVAQSSTLRDRYRTLYDVAYSRHVGETAHVRAPISRPTEDVALSIGGDPGSAEDPLTYRRRLRSALVEIVKQLEDAVKAMKSVQGPLDRLAGGGLREQPTRVSVDAIVTQDELEEAIARRKRGPS